MKIPVYEEIATSSPSSDELPEPTLLEEERIPVDQEVFKHFNQTKFYGQAGEDKIMLQYFSKNGVPLYGGVFIEIGAFDGLAYSNSKFYEDELLWTGLLVEPHPETFTKLLKNRPNPRVVKSMGAVCLNETKKEMIGYGPMAGRADTQDPVHKQKWKEEKVWEVQCSPMSKYVNDAYLSRVDLFSLDVEGGEYDVLVTFPFETVKVYAILVELNGREGTEEKDAKCREVLQSKGFEYIQNLGHGNFNELWINPNNIHPNMNR